MQVFVIGDEAKKELARIKANAESNPFSAEAMRRRIEGTWQPGHEVMYTCHIPIDYKVVFTIETGLDATDPNLSHGMYRHLSVSIAGKKKTPNTFVCQKLMNELGFINTLDSGMCQVWSEGEGIVNIIEFI